ncbi:unnamed protein product [Lampetra fluviatilis]
MGWVEGLRFAPIIVIQQRYVDHGRVEQEEAGRDGGVGGDIGRRHRCSESLRSSVTATIIPTPGHFSALRPSEQGLRLSRVEFGDEEEE